jgi:hypothetical protein
MSASSLSLTNHKTGVILVTPGAPSAEFDPMRLRSPYVPRNFSWYIKTYSRGACLPMDIRFLQNSFTPAFTPVFGKLHWRPGRPNPTAFGEFGALKHLLTTRYSLLNPTRAESTKDEFDLLFGAEDTSLTPADLAIVLPWLLAASAWRRNIELLDGRLTHLRTLAMSNPSLATFRPIPSLRQYVADLYDALRGIKDFVNEEEVQAFAQLETLAQFRLEKLDSIFDTLLKQASALSSKASNEIQLVIGSVTIQVRVTAN